jgi:hypothetical protein
MDFSVIVINLILGIPIFFLWRWIFKRFFKSVPRKGLSTLLATFITTPLVYTALIILWFLSISYYPSHRFTKQKWNSNQEKRYELSEDIIKSKVLIGKNKTEIKQILGAENNVEQSDYWTYDLGYLPGLFNIDPYVLYIEFQNGVVAKVSQHES